MSSIFRAPYFKRPIEENDINSASKKLKEILELEETENGWSDISSDEEEDDEPKTEKDEYVVEKVLAEKVEKGKLKFLVKWVGWDDEDDQTWEPIENFFTKGSKMAIYLFYQKKWKKQSKAEMKKQRAGGSSSPDAFNASGDADGRGHKKGKENQKKKNEKRMSSNDENDPEPYKSSSKSSKNILGQQSTYASTSSKKSTKPSQLAAKRHLPSSSNSSKIPPKRFNPGKKIKIFESSYPTINRRDLELRRELQQKQAKEIVEKKLQEKREAEKREREKAQREKELASQKAKELQSNERLKKLREELWGSSDESEEENEEEEESDDEE